MKNVRIWRKAERKEDIDYNDEKGWGKEEREKENDYYAILQIIN